MPTGHENDFVMDNNSLYKIRYTTVLLLGIYRDAVGESVSVRYVQEFVQTEFVVFEFYCI